MGAEVGKPISNLGITSMASTTPTIEYKEVSILIKELQLLSNQKDNNESITRKELEDCLKKCGKVEASDLDVYIQLFTLFDIEGNETVNYKDYTAGICGCLISTMKVQERLKFIFTIYTNNNSSVTTSTHISKSNLKRLLISINNVASFFGDPVLALVDIDMIIQSIYKSFSDQQSSNKDIIVNDDSIQALIQHPLTQVFMLGEGKIRFGDIQLNTITTNN